MMLLLVPAIMNNPVKAGCAISSDSDWPSAPCYGCPGCIPSKEVQREQWNPYYQYKGASWMEMMKTQMIEAMKNGTIEDWVTGNDSNYNVWRYYYLNDQAPFFRSSVSGLNDEHPYFPPPLQQLITGIAPKDVACKKGLNLVIKAEDNSPACVRPDTTQKLIERGWAILPSAYHGPAWKSFAARMSTYGNITNGTAQPLIPPPMAPLLPSHHFNYTAALYAKIPNWNQRFACYKYQGHAIQISADISNAVKFSGLVTGPNDVVHDIPSAALNSTLMQIQFSASSSDPDGNYSVAFNVVNGSNTSNVNFYCADTEMTEPMMHPPLHATPP